jgi:hypothetical protein
MYTTPDRADAYPRRVRVLHVTNDDVSRTAGASEDRGPVLVASTQFVYPQPSAFEGVAANI